MKKTTVALMTGMLMAAGALAADVPAAAAEDDLDRTVAALAQTPAGAPAEENTAAGTAEPAEAKAAVAEAPVAAAPAADPAESDTGEIGPAAPQAALPAFADFLPYVTTEKDVTEEFGSKARLYEGGVLGRRHIITGEDFGLGAKYALVSYTAEGRVSDVRFAVPAAKKADLQTTLDTLTAQMDPKGVWAKTEGGKLWLTPVAQLSVTASGPNDDITVEYGAAARRVLETRTWIDTAPKSRTMRFAGLEIGRSTLADLRERVKGVTGCSVTGPVTLADGTRAFSLKGACFGLPGEKESIAWIGADTARLFRLIVTSQGDPEGFAAAEKSLGKRYAAGKKPGTYVVAEPPAKNVRVPFARFDAKAGQLEFFADVDGVHAAARAYADAVAEKAAREAQAARVDALFQ